MPDGWQPIDTLERRAEWVLGWAPGWQVVMMTFVNVPSHGIGPGWYVGDGKYIPATHWRPLPKPPVQTQPNEK